MAKPRLDDLVRDYTDQVAEMAADVVTWKRSRLVNAEYDDLYQEGLISVWQQLTGKGVVSMGIVMNRMRDYLRFLARQTGAWLPEPGQEQHIPYDRLLPLDDYRAAEDS